MQSRFVEEMSGFWMSEYVRDKSSVGVSDD